MAKCQDCNQEMHMAKTCTENTLVINGVNHRRDSHYFDVNKRCHDCGIENVTGNFHHFGCDMERCPICGNQLISCGCLDGKDVRVTNI